jgi:hypothetical protein
VTYEVKVNNNSGTRSVTIKTLADDLYGDITMVQGDVTSTTCGTLIKTMLGPGATSSACTFTVDDGSPGSAGDVTDTVTARTKATTSPFEEVDVAGSATIKPFVAIGVGDRERDTGCALISATQAAQRGLRSPRRDVTTDSRGGHHLTFRHGETSANQCAGRVGNLRDDALQVE